LQELAKELYILRERAKYILPSRDTSNSAIAETHGTDDAPEPFRSIAFSTACLMELLPTLERTLLFASQNRVLENEQKALSFQVTEPARAYISMIYHRFKNADIRLLERLGEANWQRSVRIREQIRRVENHEELLDADALWAAQTTYAPTSKFHDSGLGTSISAKSHDAASVASQASHTSFVSGATDIENGVFRVPRTPHEVALEQPFTCFICGKILTAIKNRVDWK